MPTQNSIVAIFYLYLPFHTSTPVLSLILPTSTTELYEGRLPHIPCYIYPPFICAVILNPLSYQIIKSSEYQGWYLIFTRLIQLAGLNNSLLDCSTVFKFNHVNLQYIAVPVPSRLVSTVAACCSLQDTPLLGKQSFHLSGMVTA